MRAIELEKAYNPKDFEDRVYREWEAKGYFRPQSDGATPEDAGRFRTGERFAVVIPPPNVTGVLHLGHGLNHALQDIAVRYHRMKGDDTLWLPGTDHAGIATQHVVETRLKKEGLRRADLGREEFLRRTRQVTDEHHAVITAQQRKLGNSVDWTRERFTLDEGLSRAVREVFVSLYERGLVYRGRYLVNWCPSCGTALADDEVEHAAAAGEMHHIYYELADGSGAKVEIATTRPETLFGDTAVAVNPRDGRYARLVGKLVKLPLTGKEIPVIADEAVDKDFGTGVLKITPAHSPADWETGTRHGLPVVNVLNPDGTLNGEAPERFRGLTCEQARPLVAEALSAAGLYKGAEKITHSVGRCYRCGSTVEPFVSDQWFVRMKPMADKALEAWKRGDVVFYPRKWENTYAHWLENIRDWCISRQLWWGHRIPVWYCACGETLVSRADPERCPKCGASSLRQDPDVLDTWFSSWLWPFSTLGWPERAKDFDAFYPTTALVTGHDIIFFWVSRMIMAGLEFTGKAPFRDIFINGLVRDAQGRKMSKTLGNGLDPLELIAECGSDAVKFTLGFLCAQGQDVLVDRESFRLGSRFANKIWNASRYILGKLEGRSLVPVPDSALSAPDRWLYARLNEAAKAARNALESYRYNEAALALYEFFWNDFCDWYVEATKLSFRSGGEAEKDRAASLLLNMLEESLRLLHPFLPFVTEEIYGKLPLAELAAARDATGNAETVVSASRYGGMLIAAPYPAPNAARENAAEVARFGTVQELIRAVRTLRAECGIQAAQKIIIAINATEKSVFDISSAHNTYAELIEQFTNATILTGRGEKLEKTIGIAGNGFEVLLIVGGAIDGERLKAQFLKELAADCAFADRTEQKLAGSFARKAPSDVVAAEREKLARSRRRIEQLSGYTASL